MSKFKIRHVTRYTYDVVVRDSANQIMLYPIKDEYQEVLQHSITITGDPMVTTHLDHYGNQVGTFMHSHPHQELLVDSRMVVVTNERTLPGDHESAKKQWLSLAGLSRMPAFVDYLRTEQFSGYQELAKVVASHGAKEVTPLALSRDLCAYIYKNFKYKKGITTVETKLDEIWSIRSGVCQDFAHILLVMLKEVQIPARYVSGYICPSKSGMRGEGATHAWVEAYIPVYGWLGIDPTNNCIVNDTHVRLAVGKNFSDCSPVKGTYRGTSDHKLEVVVTVSYQDGHSTEETNEVVHPEPVTSISKNSYRRHQEMQMQQ